MCVLSQHENQTLLSAPESLGHMTQSYNRTKGTRDRKVLLDYTNVSEAHETWTSAILSHQTEWYGKQASAYSKCTPRSISKKGTDFFKVWGPWLSETKEAYDKAIAAVNFSHDLA